MPSKQIKRRDIQMIKCHIMESLLKLERDLSKNSNLKKNIVIHYVDTNKLQRYESNPKFNSEVIANLKVTDLHIKISSNLFADIKQKNI